MPKVSEDPSGHLPGTVSKKARTSGKPHQFFRIGKEPAIALYRQQNKGYLPCSSHLYNQVFKNDRSKSFKMRKILDFLMPLMYRIALP